ncbi:sensor histidine kinase [Spirosoma aerolatum]|uniref:sensor histidine kinase n=1 Tax=Spirosoma aerolatum TaxID=1211326 RepID=UPI00147517A3|nr:HAMP domain-containing sensor histidine kinase [Spirosoma aerolatum]
MKLKSMGGLTSTYFIVLLVFVGLNGGIASAQSFKFADTHPITNPDSLEHWLVLNPTPSLNRLRNLIVLERTYCWEYHDKVGKYLPEISRLTKLYHDRTADAAYQYLRAFAHYYLDYRGQTTLYANQALQIFQELGDQSGLLNTYGLLVLINVKNYQYKVHSKTQVSKEYLAQIDQILATTHDPHDLLVAKLVYIWDRAILTEKGIALMQQTLDQAFEIINKNPSCSYARVQFSRLQAHCYYLHGQYNLAYEQSKQLIRQLKPAQFWEMTVVSQNLAGYCYKLRRTDEGIALCQNVITLLSQTKPVKHHIPIKDTYDKYRQLLMQKGDYVEANRLADSIQHYNDRILLAENDEKMLELEARYEDQRKQQQILYLQQQQQQTRLLLLIVAAVLVIVGFLLYRLYQANNQLKALNKSRERFFSIIAHDLRRPMHAFQGMNELVSYYLKNQRYEAIEKLSQAIDEAGARIQLMLDNLLRWALAQRQELPYQPQLLLLAPKLREVVSLFESLPYSDSVVFTVRCSDRLQVYADPDALELILRNLVANALKAMDRQPGRLTIEATIQEASKVSIEVWDSGPGMSSAQLSSVRSVLAHPKDGQLSESNRGLGLILVSEFTHRNRGKIRVESSAEGGTRFTLVLPGNNYL